MYPHQATSYGDLIPDSEFKDQFEAACQKLKLPLYVNPPRCPELNGHIERANRTSREEFYEVQDLEMSVEG